MTRKTTVDAAWAALTARAGKKTFKPWKASKHDAEVFDCVLTSVWLPEPLEAWFRLHGGEVKPEALAPLRLVSLDEATDFALGLVGQLPADAHVSASEKLAKKHFASASRQKFGSATEYCCVWTLALGEPGHRLALDLDEGFVVEFFADGRAEKRADDFDGWLQQLAGAAPASKPVKKKAPARKPVKK